MIKYKINLGSDHLNSEARRQRDYAYKPQLAGIYCGKCKGIDTIVEFYQMPAQFNMVNARIQACCIDFDRRIRQEIGKQED